MNSKLVYKFLTDDDFLLISDTIKETEKITSGEIRVSIKESKPVLKKSKDIRELAEEEFFRLKMNDTRDRTGILLFLILKEKKFYILADSGIDDKVKQETWDKVRDGMALEFKAGNFRKGIIHGISRVGEILSEHFPIKPDDTNELSNQVVF